MKSTAAPHPAVAAGRAVRRLAGTRMRRWLGAGAGLVVAALVVRTLVGSGAELSRATELLSHPALGWLAVAIICELLAYVAYAGGQRGLLAAVGRPLGIVWLASLSVAAQCLGNFLPAGYVAANLLNYRELRRRELSAAATTWLLLTSSVLYAGALALLALVGTQIAGHEGGAAASEVRLAAYAALAIALASGLLAFALARRGLLGRLRSRLAGIALARRRLAAAGALFLVGWIADAACLAAAFFAVGGAPPWSLLLMAFAAAQLVAFLPVTPGGLGLVEGSLALTLAAGGGAKERVLAAVLLYRLISYWGTLPAGALGYLHVRRQGDRLAAPPHEAPPELPAPAAAAAVAATP